MLLPSPATMCSGKVSKNAEDTGPRGPAALYSCCRLYTISARCSFSNISISSPADFPHIALPIGISFSRSDNVVYHRRLSRRGGAQRNIFKLGLYIACFRSLSQGRLCGISTSKSSLPSGRMTPTSCFAAPRALSWDWQRKCACIQKPSRRWLTFAFGKSTGELNAATAWLGALCYGLQIYTTSAAPFGHGG